MGVCGHLDAQRALIAARAEIVALQAEPVPSIDDAWTGGSLLELAVMRHETGLARLFAN
jgi:urease accessory protein UreF